MAAFRPDSHVCSQHLVSLDFITDVEYDGLRKETSHQQDCCPNHFPIKTRSRNAHSVGGGLEAGQQFFFLTMLRQHYQYDSRLGFSFMVLVLVRVRLGLR